MLIGGSTVPNKPKQPKIKKKNTMREDSAPRKKPRPPIAPKPKGKSTGTQGTKPPLKPNLGSIKSTKSKADSAVKSKKSERSPPKKKSESFMNTLKPDLHSRSGSRKELFDVESKVEEVNQSQFEGDRREEEDHGGSHPPDVFEMEERKDGNRDLMGELRNSNALEGVIIPQNEDLAETIVNESMSEEVM